MFVERKAERILMRMALFGLLFISSIVAGYCDNWYEQNGDGSTTFHTDYAGSGSSWNARTGESTLYTYNQGNKTVMYSSGVENEDPPSHRGILKPGGMLREDDPY